MKRIFKKNPKLVMIISLLILLLFVLISFPLFAEKRVIDIEDKCGKFVNLLSHTIENEAVCKSRCRAQCESIDFGYDKIDFKESDTTCNKCTCYCSRW